MKNLSKEKKQQLMLVVIGTAGVMAAIWFGLISMQQHRLDALASQRATTKSKLDGMNDTLKRASQILTDGERETERLQTAEQQMASGDIYVWMFNTVRDFKAKYPAVSLPDFSPIQVGETTLLPKFPYQQAVVTVRGRAYYHDLGRFLADFENEFPYMRFQNLVLEPSPAMEGGYTQKLAFRVDIVTLVNPEA